MEKATIFYSWQSDRPRTRDLIQGALDEARHEVGRELCVDLELDKDSHDESGSPKIPDSVQGKIRQAAAFVADLTIVALRDQRPGGLPNGNVGIEWGFAEATLGSQALVGVMNTHYGDADHLPVDLRQNLVRVYFSWDEGNTDAVPESILRELTNDLQHEILRAIRARFFRAFNPGAPQIVQFLVRDSPHAMADRHLYEVTDLARRAGVEIDTVRATMEDLLNFGLARENGGSGWDLAITPLMSLYVHFDPLYKGWSADHDAREIAKRILGQSWLGTEQLRVSLGWEIRQINPALFRLEQGDFAEFRSGPGDLYRARLQSNGATRSLAEGRASLPPLAPRARFPLD